MHFQSQCSMAHLTFQINVFDGVLVMLSLPLDATYDINTTHQHKICLGSIVQTQKAVGLCITPEQLGKTSMKVTYLDSEQWTIWVSIIVHIDTGCQISIFLALPLGPGTTWLQSMYSTSELPRFLKPTLWSRLGQVVTLIVRSLSPCRAPQPYMSGSTLCHYITGERGWTPGYHCTPERSGSLGLGCDTQPRGLETLAMALHC